MSNIEWGRPKKRLSQNFLIDKNMARRIVNAAEPKEGDHIIEVGPGRGMLTEIILSTGAGLTCIELDIKLAEELRSRFSGGERGAIDIIQADALKFSFTTLAKEKGQKLKLISNLPYNISGPMMARLVDEREAFSLMVLMFQREVAERLVAGPGSKAYGSLSVLARTFTEPKMEFDVRPELFRPVPKVYSSVVSFRVLESPRVVVEDYPLYKRVVRAAFGQRRKTLRNALAVLGMDREEVEGALDGAGIDASRRGETLTLEEFSALAISIGKVEN